jgi:predicted Zn-dependent protease with MMP-like domain
VIRTTVRSDPHGTGWTSPERFERLVAEALDDLPAWVQERLENVEVLIEELPPSDHPHVLGLYEGIPLTNRGRGYFGVLPDRITLFRRPIQAVARNDRHMRRVVRDTVVHEIAHFFGISDQRLQELGRD